MSPLKLKVPSQLRKSCSRLAAGAVPGAWLYAPLFNTGSLADYLPKGALLLVDEPAEVEQALADLATEQGELKAELVRAGDLPAAFPDALLPLERLLAKAAGTLHRWGGEEDETLPFEPAVGYGGRLRTLVTDVQKAAGRGAAVVLASLQSGRLAEVLADDDTLVTPVAMCSNCAVAAKTIAAQLRPSTRRRS